MDKNILGGVLAIPLLLVSGTFAAGGTCDFTKPGLVFERACIDSACLTQVQKHLPGCQRRFAGSLTKTIRHAEGVEKAPFLSLAIMDKLSDCIAKAGYGAFNKISVDFSEFREISKDVRAKKLKRAAGDCSNGDCTGLYLLPVVGQTTFLHGPA